MQKPAICKNCINFLIDKDEICTCDYEYWENISLYQAVLYTPEMFNCLEFEYSLEIKEEIENEKNISK